MRQLDKHATAHLLGTRCAFYRRGKDGNENPCDLPGDVVDQLLAIVPSMRTRELKAIAHGPFARPDGSLVLTPGYDAATGVYAHFDVRDIAPIPTKPTERDVIEAIRDVWGPCSAYPYATPHDRAGAFAYLMTAVIRPGIDIAPGFLFDAPTQASGKTRHAQIGRALLSNERGGVTPFVGGLGSEAELAKKLVALVRAGEGSLILDNVVGHFRSAVISATITDGVLNERVLGSSTWYRGAVRLLLGLTSNNASIDKDLLTRLIRVRLDPQCENPQSRVFTFDPVDRALRERLKIARGVLVLIRAHREAGAPRGFERGSRFEGWASLVRDPIGWAQKLGFFAAAGVGVMGDPEHSTSGLDAKRSPDEEALALLLEGIELTWGAGVSFVSRELLQQFNAGEHSRNDGLNMIRDGLEAMLGSQGLTAARLGLALENRREKVVGGRRLEALTTKTRSGSTQWVVRRCAG